MSNEKGFTLIELMVVVGIMAVIMAIGIFGITRYMAKERLNEAVNVLVADIQRARAWSITRGQLSDPNLTVTCSDGTSGTGRNILYGLMSDNTASYNIFEFCDKNGDFQFNAGTERFNLQTTNLPGGVTITSGNIPAIIFDKKGMAKSSKWLVGGQTIQFTDTDGDKKSVVVSNDGRVSVTIP